MKKVRLVIRDYFGFSPKETRGFFLLLVLIFFALLLPLTVKSFLPSTDTSAADNEKLDNIIASLDWSSKSYNKTASASNFNIRLAFFDPNTASTDELKRLGLDEKIVNRIVNYRTKGGKFAVKNDFRKVYGLTEQKFLELYPYIQLPERKEVFSKAHYSPSENWKKREPLPQKSLIKFDINTADTVQLESINGIGNKLAKRIISYRNKLGGFVSKEQFKEIYGLDSLVIEKLKNATLLSPEFAPRKISINRANFNEIKLHPYISYSIAKTIIAYREQHGLFNSVSDLKKIHNIDAQTLSKLEPYLEL